MKDRNNMEGTKGHLRCGFLSSELDSRDISSTSPETRSTSGPGTNLDSEARGGDTSPPEHSG